MPSISFFHPFQGDYPLPPTIKRTCVQTSSGALELLVAEPKNRTAPHKQPFFFAHGGCGGAAVWLEWMDYFSQRHDIPCYAVSYRGHGSSWYPSYLRMYFTTKRTLANDLVSGVKHATELEKQATGYDVKLVLVGHSSGGGLSQLVLSDGDLKVNGLALVAAIPCFGSTQVNKNWLVLDPWFSLRMFFRHLGHPMSPLSSSRLVKAAFFCTSYPIALVKDFEKRMPRMESMLWPLGMLWRFVSCRNVIRNIIGWGTTERIAIIAAEHDKLVDALTARKTGDEYRQAFGTAVTTGEIEAKISQVETNIEGESKGLGVRYYEVKGAGHHCQNDLQWENAAEKLLEFYQLL